MILQANVIRCDGQVRQRVMITCMDYFGMAILPKTLNEVFDCLTAQYGHHHLWLKLEPLTYCPGNCLYPINFYVVSSSGQELAEFDGTWWYYINPCFLTFNVMVHGVPPSTVGHFQLDKNNVIGFMGGFGI